MKRTGRSLSTRGADALSKALKNENKNYQSEASRARPQAAESGSLDSYAQPPSTLKEDRPRIDQSFESGLVKPFARQFAVLLKVHDKWVVSHPLNNPAANASESTQVIAAPYFPGEVVEKIQDLEKEGYFYSGINKDMIVFERVYDQRKRGRIGAYRSTGTLVLSVVLLTGALFAIERVL